MPRPRDIRQLDDLGVVFAALAHPARREVLQVLHARGGELGAGELAARFEHSWPTTSRHLAVLVESRLITVRKRGRERRYTMNRDRLVGGLGLWLHNVDVAVIDRDQRSGSEPSTTEVPPDRSSESEVD
jgi:DNA-binding transcriptional ArsR family regulator